MKKVKVIYEVYKFNELSKEAKEKAQEMAENVELPKEYVTDSFEIIRIGKLDKDGNPNYKY